MTSADARREKYRRAITEAEGFSFATCEPVDYLTAADAVMAEADKELERAEHQGLVAVWRLDLAHQARRAKDDQLAGIRRALCDTGIIRDDDPYSHADLADVIRQNAAPKADPDNHVYLSTGCLHGNHTYCQNPTGQSGSKRPSECKFCAAPCTCECHQTTEETR